MSRDEDALFAAVRGKNSAPQRGALLDRERPLCNPPQRLSRGGATPSVLGR